MFSIALLVAVLLLPSRGHLRPEYLLVGLLVVGIIAQRGFGPFAYVRHELTLLAFLTITGLLSILVYNLGEGTFHYRDLLSIVRYPVYGAILAAAAVSTRSARRSKEKLGSAIGLIALVVVVISFLQQFDVGGFDSLLQTAYPNSERGLNEPEYGTFAAGRLTGTATNPNWWGFTIVALFLMLTARVLIAKRIVWIPILFLLTTCLILTGSRTAAVAALIGVGLIMTLGVLTGATSIGRVAISGFVAVLVIGWGVFYQLNLAADTRRFNMDNMGSFLMRVGVWNATLQEYENDIVLGRGPAKLERRAGFRDASSFAVRDNIYIAYLAQFGIVGLVGFLGFSLTQVTRLFALTKRADPPDRWWPVGMLGVMAAWMLYGVTADSFFFVPASNILLVLYGTALMASGIAPDPSKQHESQQPDAGNHAIGLTG